MNSAFSLFKSIILKKILIWIHVQRKYPIIFFDATGGICRNIADQNIPLIYSMIVYDVDNKSYLPIAEFITTSHCQLNLNLFLYEIKFNMERYREISHKKYKFPLPFFFIVDQNWASISSLLSIFAGMNVSEYLVFAYQAVLENNSSVSSRFTCIIYLCKIHLLRNFLKKSKKIKHSKETEVIAKKCLGFCFTLLQEAEALDQFEIYLKQIFDVFCIPR